MKDTLNRVASYVKKYWKVAALVIGLILGYFIFRKRESDFTKRLNDINVAHAKEIKKIDDARKEEKKKLEENEKRLKEALEEVKRAYESAKLELSKKKEREIEKIVKEHGDDPTALANALAESTGFKIILPER